MRDGGKGNVSIREEERDSHPTSQREKIVKMRKRKGNASIWKKRGATFYYVKKRLHISDVPGEKRGEVQKNLCQSVKKEVRRRKLHHSKRKKRTIFKTGRGNLPLQKETE